MLIFKWAFFPDWLQGGGYDFTFLKKIFFNTFKTLFH